MWEDTEATVGDLQVPQVHPEIVSGDERLKVRVDRDGVDVVGVGIAEHTSGCSLNHQVHRLQHWHLLVQMGELERRKKTKRIFTEGFDEFCNIVSVFTVYSDGVSLRPS